jgi:cadmium resistance protein CadD (predicted permease)
MGGSGDAVSTLGIALLTLFATNLDTLATLAPTLWAGLDRGGLRRTVMGCSAGNAVILLLALLAASGLSVTPPSWTRCTGLVPLAIGLWRLRAARAKGTGADSGVHTAPGAGGLGGAGITVSLGLDNIAVLAPVLHAYGGLRAAAVVAVHLTLFPMLVVGVAALARLRRRRRLVAAPVAPCLTIAAGAVVLARSLLG